MPRRSFLFLWAIALCIALCPPLWATDKEDDELVEKQYEYYRSLPNIKPKKREVYFYETRNYPYSRIPLNARVKALEYTDRMQSQGKGPHVLAEQPQWRSIGPFDVGGRVRSIVVHPTDPKNVYIGTAAGGAWHTTDGGENWTPIFDNQNASAFGSLALDPNNPSVIWAATGEIEASIDAYLGNGIYKSTDAGQTWSHIGLANIGAFSKIYVHPLNSDFIVAGAVKNGAGFYKSTDGGQSWQKTFSGPVSDVSIDAKSQDHIYIGVTGEGVYHSGDGGNTFTFLGTGFPTFNVGRVSIQASKSNPETVYCFIVKYEFVTETERIEYPAIYKSTNRGQQWQEIFASGDPDFFRNQGFYNHFLDIHPTNPNIAFVGGIDVFRTLDGNKWNNVTFVYDGGSVHPDQHCLAFAPSDPNTIYLGNDGGMYVSKDGGYNWSPINNGLAITQFYKMGVNQNEPNINYGGSQDNGTQGSMEGVPNWTAVGGGDGGYVVVDHANPNIIFGSYQEGQMWKRNVQTGQMFFLPLPTQEVDAPLFIAPHIMDPQDNNILYHGRSKLYFSADGGNDWTTLPGLPTLQGSISAINVSYAGGYAIFIGTARGEFYLSRDGGDTWINAGDNGLPKRFVTDIVPSQTDAQTVYVSISGFGTSHVFKTIDGGNSWIDIGRGLPDIPCGSIAIDPSNESILFAGTDIGVFVTYDGGNSWLPFGKGLPRTHVADLEFHRETRVLRAATHGRSMWEVDVPATAVEATGITAPAGGENYNAQSSQVISWYGFSGSVKVEYSVNDGANWTTLAEAATGNHLRWQIPDRPTITARVRITPNGNPGAPVISNTFAINKFAPGSVLSQSSVNHVAYGLAYDGKGGLWTTSFYGNKLYKLNAVTFQIESSFEIPGGDSLYTDVTMDRATQTLYVHKLNRSTNPNGGKILVLSTTGELLRQFDSPCTKYPVGLAWVNGMLLASDRDTRKLFWADPVTGAKSAEETNPFQKYYGPRGLCTDGNGNCYQASTDFSGNSLQGAYNVQFDTENFTEARRMDLRTNTGTINARGIEFDPADKTFWVSDFEGSIYKTAGFEIETDVRDDQPGLADLLTVSKLAPNPFNENTVVGFALAKTSHLRVEVFSAAGNSVVLLHNGVMQAGEHSLTLRGSQLASGVYTVVFSIDNVPVVSHNAILLR